MTRTKEESVRQSNGLITAAVLLSLATGSVLAEERTLAREGILRIKPGPRQRMVTTLPAGTTVDATETTPGGWVKVRTTDGRDGWLWAENLAPEAAAQPDASPSESAPSVRPASSEDIEGLRREIDRLATAQDQMRQAIEDRRAFLDGPFTSPTDGTAGAAALFLAIGAVLGWIASRLAARRGRERRHRIRV